MVVNIYNKGIEVQNPSLFCFYLVGAQVVGGVGRLGQGRGVNSCWIFWLLIYTNLRIPIYEVGNISQLVGVLCKEHVPELIIVTPIFIIFNFLNQTNFKCVVFINLIFGLPYACGWVFILFYVFVSLTYSYKLFSNNRIKTFPKNFLGSKHSQWLFFLHNLEYELVCYIGADCVIFLWLEQVLLDSMISLF